MSDVTASPTHASTGLRDRDVAARPTLASLCPRLSDQMCRACRITGMARPIITPRAARPSATKRAL